jgi:hypothetical protein
MRTLLAISLLAACGSSPTTKSVDPQEARNLLLDRNWIDRMPETKHDKLHVYRFVPSMGGGVFQDRTIYKGVFELFKFEATGDHIRFDLLETGDKVTSRYKIEEVKGPKPFDLKLTIGDDPRGPHVYYGIRAETDRDGVLLQQHLDALPE